MSAKLSSLFYIFNGGLPSEEPIDSTWLTLDILNTNDVLTFGIDLGEGYQVVGIQDATEITANSTLLTVEFAFGGTIGAQRVHWRKSPGGTGTNLSIGHLLDFNSVGSNILGYYEIGFWNGGSPNGLVVASGFRTP